MYVSQTTTIVVAAICLCLGFYLGGVNEKLTSNKPVVVQTDDWYRGQLNKLAKPVEINIINGKIIRS